MKKKFSHLVALILFSMLLFSEYSPYSVKKKKAIRATTQPTKTLPLNQRVIVDRPNCLCNIYTPPVEDMQPQNSGPSVTASHSFDHKRLYNKWKSKAVGVWGVGGVSPPGSRPRLGLSLVLCILWGGNLQPGLWRQSCSDLPGGTTEEDVPPPELRCFGVARGDWQQSPWSVAKFPANLKHTSFHWAELFFQEGGREGGSERPSDHKDQKKTN